MLPSPGDTGERELQVWPLGGGYWVRGGQRRGSGSAGGLGRMRAGIPKEARAQAKQEQKVVPDRRELEQREARVAGE